MVLVFLFMTKIKREQEAARMKTSTEIEACAFPYDKSPTNWSAEEFVDGSYKISSFINQI